MLPSRLGTGLGECVDDDTAGADVLASVEGTGHGIRRVLCIKMLSEEYILFALRISFGYKKKSKKKNFFPPIFKLNQPLCCIARSSPPKYQLVVLYAI